MFSFRSICACRVFFLSSASIIFRINIIVIIIHFSLTALLLFIDNLLSEDVEGGRQVLTEERGFFLFALSFRREGKSMALVSVLPSRHSRLTCSIASRVPVSVQRRPPAVSQKNPKVTKWRVNETNIAFMYLHHFLCLIPSWIIFYENKWLSFHFLSQILHLHSFRVVYTFTTVSPLSRPIVNELLKDFSVPLITFPEIRVSWALCLLFVSCIFVSL